MGVCYSLNRSYDRTASRVLWPRHRGESARNCLLNCLKPLTVNVSAKSKLALGSDRVLQKRSLLAAVDDIFDGARQTRNLAFETRISLDGELAELILHLRLERSGQELDSLIIFSERRETALFGNAKEYSYHFKTQVDREQVAPLLSDVEWYLKVSCYPDYETQIYVEDSHDIDEMLEAFRSVGLSPVPETIADEPWAYRPDEETIEEYVARCGL